MASNENLNIQNKTFTDAQMKQIAWTLDTQFWWDTQKFQQSVVKQYGQDAWNTLQGNIKNTAQIKQNTPNQSELEAKIKSGNFSASDTKAYNEMIGSNTWARDLALWSQQAVWAGTWSNFTTSITSEEAKKMQDTGINQVSKQRITTEQTPNQNIVKETITTPNEKISEVIETPKYQSVLDRAIESSSISDVRNKLKSALSQWQITQEEYNKSESYLADKLYQKEENISNIEKNPDNIFNTLKSGWIIYNSDVLNSSEYRQAKTRFDIYNQYKNYSQNQFSQALSKGLLLPWTTLYNDLIQDERIRQEIDKANILNKINEITPSEEDIFINQWNEIANNTKVTINWQTNTLAQIFEDWMITQEEYNQMTNTPEITSKYQEVETLKNEVNTLENTYKNIRTEAEKELKWSWATKSQMEALIWQRQRDILWPLELAMSRYNNALWTLTQMKSDASQLFATNLSLYQQQLQRQQQLDDRANERAYQYFMTQENRAYQEWLTQEQRAYNEALTTKQLEQKFDYTYWNLNSTDERVRNLAIKNAIADLYTQYPLPGMESQAQKEAKVNQLIAQWMTPQKALAQLESEIRWSQRYKDYIANQSIKNQTTIKPIIENFGTSTNPEYRQYNTNTGTWDKINWIWSNISSSNYYGQFRITQNAWDKSPNSKDTWYNGWTPGIDFAMPVWSDVYAIIWGKVIWAQSNKDYGMQVIIQDNEGNQHMYSHLSDGLMKIWDIVQPWQLIAKSWNTWFSTWPHLDYRVKGSNGKWLDPNNFLNGWWDYTQSDIMKFNNSTFKPQSDLKTAEDKAKYEKYLEDRKKVFNDKNANIYDILAYSAWWSWLDSSQSKSLEKFDSALSQLWGIQEQISNMVTGPILWRLRNLNPYDTDAQTLKAQLTSLIPNLARWVYWEVWVLTDNDVRLYSQTIPNLTSTNDVNNAILAMTLKVVAGWYKRQLQTLAASWKDVSWFTWLYDNLMGQVEAIENSIWIWAWNTTTNSQSWNNIQTVNSSSWNTYNLKPKK